MKKFFSFFHWLQEPQAPQGNELPRQQDVGNLRGPSQTTGPSGTTGGHYPYPVSQYAPAQVVAYTDQGYPLVFQQPQTHYSQPSLPVIPHPQFVPSVPQQHPIYAAHGPAFQTTNPVQVPIAPHTLVPTGSIPRRILDSEIEEESNEDEVDNENWPQGSQEREILLSEYRRGWGETSWVWRSNGNDTKTGDGIRRCLGVFSCNQCQRRVRPKTNSDTIKAQLGAVCAIAGCRGNIIDEGPKCHAQIRISIVNSRHGALKKWKHSGVHNHRRPPPKSLTTAQRTALAREVALRPEATVHQLRTGVPGGQNQPITGIAPKLADPEAARYEVQKAKEEQGIRSNVGRGGFAMIQSLQQLQEDASGPFILYSAVHGPYTIACQTPQMDEWLRDAVQDWVDGAADGANTGRHGFVTDGDHSYFRQGNLLVTVVFNRVLNAWVPVLCSWIHSLDASHHQAHFLALFRRVKIHAGAKFAPWMLGTVVDFSDAQKNGHADAFAQIFMEDLPGLNGLSDAAVKAQRKFLRDQALHEYQQGCSVHFGRSVTRVERNGELVSAESTARFESLVHVLRGVTTDMDLFEKTVKEIRAEFPRVRDWLSWWLRPSISCMIFPVFRQLDPAIAARIPLTSNAVEHQHSLLHHAVGTRHDLVPGLLGIKLHIEELKKRQKAILDGDINPPRIRDHRRTKSRPFDENDGRAPDTVASLQKAADTERKSHNVLIGYQWKDNSCFIDAPLELLYRVFKRWPKLEQDEFRRHLSDEAPPGNTPLADMMWHFKMRSRLESEMDPQKLLQELQMMQSKLRNAIDSRWRLSLPGKFGEGSTWRRHLILDYGSSEELGSSIVALQFWIQHRVHWLCPNGHELSSVPSKYFNRELLLTMFDRCHAASYADKLPTLQDLVSKAFIPRLENGARDTPGANIHRPVHELSATCAFDGCEMQTTPKSIKTSWPQILEIRHGAEAHPVQLAPPSHSFTIPSQAASPVEYELVGRVIFSSKKKHYTAEILEATESNGGIMKTYSYDGMRNSVDLGKNRCAKLLLEGTEDRIDQVVKPDEYTFYMYNRVSTVNKTTFAAEYLQERYAKGLGIWNDARNTAKDRAMSVHTGSPDPPPVDAVLQHPVQPTKPGKAREFSVKSKAVQRKNQQVDVSVSSDSSSESNGSHRCLFCTYLPSHKTSETIDWVQCDCCSEWSHTECVQSLEGYPQPSQETHEDNWKCGRCLLPLYNGQAFLFKTVKKKKNCRYYAAFAVGDNKENLQLVFKWYTGNIYLPSESPSRPNATFAMSLKDCFASRAENYTKSDVNAIKWPSALSVNAVDEYGYTNDELTRALDLARTTLKAIVSGERHHPITDLFQQWMKTKPRRSSALDHASSFGSAYFEYYVLPADRGLIEEWLGKNVFEWKGFTADHTEHWSTVVILAELVATRVYLQRTYQDDAEIYFLAQRRMHALQEETVFATAMDGCITRSLSQPEQVLAAAQQVVDTSYWQHDMKVESDMGELWNCFKLEIVDENFPIKDLVTTASNGGTYQWGLLGDLPLMKAMQLVDENVNIGTGTGQKHSRSASDDSYDKPGYVEKLKKQQATRKDQSIDQYFEISKRERGGLNTTQEAKPARKRPRVDSSLPTTRETRSQAKQAPSTGTVLAPTRTAKAIPKPKAAAKVRKR